MLNSAPRIGRLLRRWTPGKLPRGQTRFQGTSQKSLDQTAGKLEKSQTASVSTEATTAASNPSITSQVLNVLVYPGRLYSNAQSRSPYLTQVATSITIYFCGDLSTQYVRRPQPTADSDDGSGRAASQPQNATNSPSPSASASSSTSFFRDVYDPTRSLRNIIIGAVSSIPSYRWFLYLGTIGNYSNAVASLSAKVVVNQIVFTPLFNSYFFGMQSLLAGLIPSKAPASTTSVAAGSAQPTIAAAAPVSLLDDPAVALSEAGLRVRETVPTSWYNSCFFWPFVTAFNYQFIPARNRSAFAGVVAVGWQTYLGLLNQRAIDKEAKALAGGKAL